MKRLEFSRKTRREALRRAGKKCEGVGMIYGLVEGFRCNQDLSAGVEFDHDKTAEEGGDNDLENCVCLCRMCHKYKTVKDIQRIRKGDRQRDKHDGTFKPSANPVPGSKGTRWRKRMDGTVEER